MNRTLWRILLAVAIACGLFAIGCSDEDDNPPPPPDYMQLLDGNWDAEDLYTDSLGIDQQRYTFSNPTDTYHLLQTSGSTTYDYTGTYSAVATTITFHETSQDGNPVDITYERDYSLSSGDSVMILEYDDPVNHMNIVYDKAPI